MLLAPIATANAILEKMGKRGEKYKKANRKVKAFEICRFLRIDMPGYAKAAAAPISGQSARPEMRAMTTTRTALRAMTTVRTTAQQASGPASGPDRLTCRRRPTAAW